MSPNELDSMCLTWTHDFGLMSEEEKEKIRALMRGLFEHHVKPLANKAAALEKDCHEFQELFHELKGQLERIVTDFSELKEREGRLVKALHDAIRRPMGTVPASAEEFYSYIEAQSAELRRPRAEDKDQERKVSF